MTLELLEVGTLVNAVDGYTYGKTAPWGILTQALSGSYEVTYAGHTEFGPTGTMMFLPRQVPWVVTHHADPRSGVMTIRFVHFRFLLRNGVDAVDLLRLPYALPPLASVAVGSLIQALLDLAGGDRSFLGDIALRQELGFRLLRILTEHGEMRPGAAEALDEAGPIATLLREMEARPGEDWTVERLAHLARMSRASLYRHFAGAVGVTPMEHLKRVRLDEGAKRLLHDTATISRIASEVGFATPDHFGREFARRFGVTPTMYRNDPIFGRAAALDRGPRSV